MAKFSRLLFLFLLGTLLSFITANQSFAEPEPLIKARPSYWTPTGQNLTPEKTLLPILKREELFKLLKGKDKVLFLDIREPHEFQKSHLPNAFNIPFSNREAYYDQLKSNSAKTFIPYCNWDFRGYVAGIELKRHGFSNVMMMYPHGLRGWMAEGLPVAGEDVGKTDEEGARALMTRAVAGISSVILRPKAEESPAQRRLREESGDPSPAKDLWRAQDDRQGKTLHIPLRILAKQVEPRHIEASVGDQLILDLISEEEDHWFVIPDFDVNLHLNPGERKTIVLNLTRSGYFPMGCISCCTRYQCQIKQAILVDLKESVTNYGE